jgi:DNA-binding transcriptional LysR family regulator
LPRARAALSDSTAVLRPPAAFDAKTAVGTVTIALGEDMQQMAAAAILLELRKRAPSLDLRLRILGPQTVGEARRGEVDVALVPKLSDVELPDLSDFVVKPLYERRFVTVGRRNKRPTLDEFCALDHVLVSFGGDDRGYVDASLEKLGRKRRVAVTVQGFGTALKVLARRDDLIGTLPHDVCRALAPKHLHTWPCPVATPRFPMCLAWLARDTHSERHRFIREHVQRAVLASIA